MSRFPTSLDTDADLPMVTNNITEVGAEVINDIRAAIFAIEAALGAGINGSAISLQERINTVLNPDGTFKSAALVAAGLIALPITNAMVGASAAILESKLDLDHSTQSLYNQIISNDVDIATLQTNISAVLANFLSHVSGAAFKHDGYQILLETAHPTSPPPNIAPLASVSVGDAVFKIKDYLFDHIDQLKVGAHTAANIALDTSELTRITASNLQQAVQQLEVIGETLFIDHRDDLHASGFSNFANSRDGYGINRQLLPTQYGATVTAYIMSDRQTVFFDGYVLAALGINAGDVVVVTSPVEARLTIEGVGPRLALGSKSALTNNQLSLAEHAPVDGYIAAAIYTPSSTSLLKGNMAPTIHQSDIRVDSIQVSRPNAARITTLGLNPKFITAAHSIGIEVGVGNGQTRTISVNNLHLTRSGLPSPTVTIDTIVERLNHVFHNRSDGYAYPVSAYRVGDEIMLSHNWVGSDEYFLSITSLGSTTQSLYILGLDDYGASVVDARIYPTQNASLYINGARLTDVGTILQTTANISGQIFTFPGGENPLELGVKIGHLLHLKTHANASEVGTYFITGVNTSSITIHKNAGITAENGVYIEVFHDVIPLDELQGYTQHSLIEVYCDYEGKLGYDIRWDNDLVTNVTNSIRVVDVSDNFAAGGVTIDITAAGTGRRLTFTGGIPREIPYDFSGEIKLRDLSNASYATLRIQSPIIGTGTITATSHSHTLEEEVLELCAVWFDGGLTLNHIRDRRLFGTTGLDEIREDVVREYSELPIRELRADGIITGLDIITVNYTDAESIANLGSNIYGILFRGGTVYVDGVRTDVSSQVVYFPYQSASYIAYINHLGNIHFIPHGTTSVDGYSSVAEVLDGYIGPSAPIALVTHSGSGVTPLSAVDLRYFINNLDNKLDLVLDISNRRIGNIASFEAAEYYINNSGADAITALRIASNTPLTSISTSVGSKSYTLSIDGSVGSLTLNSSIRLTSNSTKYPAIPQVSQLTIADSCISASISNIHISGSITIDSVSDTNTVEFNNCIFDGAITSSALSYAKIIFKGCTFSDMSSVLIEGDDIRIEDCTVTTNSFTLELSRTCSVTNCNFSADSVFATFTRSATLGVSPIATHLVMSGCRFDGQNGGYTLGIAVTSTISDCAFSNITKSTDSLVGIIDVTSNTANPDVIVQSCTFESLTVSSGHKVTLCEQQTLLEVSNCIFTSCTLPTAVNLVATKFNNNLINIHSSSTLHVALTGSLAMCNYNEQLGSVEYLGAGSAEHIQAIVGNVFSSTDSLGYNISINSTGTVVSPISITDNKIVLKVLLSTAAKYVIISNNVFTGSSAQIDFGTLSTSSAYIVVDKNTFNTVTTPFAFSNPVGTLIIRDNLFESITSGTVSMTFASNCTYASNISLDVNTIVEINNPSSISNISIIDNILGHNFYISSPLTSSRISGNIFNSGGAELRLNTSMTLSSTIISDNRIGTLRFTSGNTLTDVLLDNNYINTITNSAVWTRSIISNNRLSSTMSAFDCGATGENIFTGNNSTSALQLTSSTTILKCSVTNNTVGDIDILAAADSLSICANTATDISLVNADSAFISNNILDGAVAIIGQIFNSSISQNRVDSLDIRPSTGSNGLDITDNIISTTLDIFEQSGSTANEISNLKIFGNTVYGNIEFFGPTNASAHRTVTNLNISNNNMQALTILGSARDPAAIFTIDIINISHNQCEDITLLSLLGDATNISNITIIGNKCEDIATHAGAASVGTMSNYSIQHNYCNRIAINTGGGLFTAEDIIISHNILSGFIFIDAYDTLISATIKANDTPSTISLGAADTISFTNISDNASGAGIGISVDTGILSNMIISQNRIIGNLTVTSNNTGPSGTVAYSAMHIADNIATTLEFTLGPSNLVMENSIISANTLSANINLPGRMTNTSVMNNIASAISLADSTAASSITRLNFCFNTILTTCTLPSSESCFVSGSGQSKFIGNFAATWSAPGTFNTSGDTYLFPLGNTSTNASSNVTFAGTTAVDITTMNNVDTIAGGGITN
jgi:hypothetical protein